jgi:hypothetical protein
MSFEYEHEAAWREAADRPRGCRQLTTFPAKSGALVSAAREYLIGRSLDPAVAFTAGWYPAMYSGPRLIIPCQRTDGIFWQGRLLENVTPPNGYKRWDSPPGSKGDALVFLPGRRHGVPILVVEGPMDALAGASSGYPGVATLGVAPTRATVTHIAALVHSYPRTILLPDHDSVGKWVTLQGMLAQHGVYARIVELSPYKDLAEVPTDEREGFLGAL